MLGCQLVQLGLELIDLRAHRIYPQVPVFLDLIDADDSSFESLCFFE